MRASKSKKCCQLFACSARILFFVFGFYIRVFSQDGIKQIITATDTLRNRLPIEKPYLSFDKPYYTSGDTLWFKAYLFNADFFAGSTRSGILYLELANDSNFVVKRAMVPLRNGIGQGALPLINKEIPTGSYILRAYTNWMRNFVDDYVFKKHFYITPSATQAYLVNAGFKDVKRAGKDNIEVGLQFTGLDRRPLRLQAMQLKVMNGQRVLHKDNIATKIEGDIDANFELPEKINPDNLVITAQQINKNEATPLLTIPVTLNRPEHIDLQFMPEGGNLVTGLPTRVGFKAVGEDGKGVDVAGKIYNSQQAEIAAFQSSYKGMGSFELIPEVGEIYTARIVLPDGAIKSYPLPVVNPIGTGLKIIKESDDSLEVIINATKSLINTNISATQYYLIGQSRGLVCYAATVNLKNPTAKYHIATSIFPTGIARFTLLNANHQPLNERLVYIDRSDDLNISIVPMKPAYRLRDSIALAVQVTDYKGQPVRGTFSIAVADGGQVKTDSLAANILTSLLLSSDLKGYVEEPAYYLKRTAVAQQALDNLLLTQGWVGYDWKQVFSSNAQNTPQYKAEMEFTVQGKVTNILNRAVVGTHVSLYSKKPLILADTVTNKQGRFIFRNILPLDTPSIIILARNKKNESANIGVDLDEFRPPVFGKEQERFIPWYVNSDTSLLSNIKTKALQQELWDKVPQGGHILKEVKITAKKIVKDSKNLNGPGEADQVFDDKDINKAGNITLGEFLEKNVKGFKVYGVGRVSNDGKSFFTSYVLTDKVLHFVFDGIDANKFYNGSEIGPLSNPDRYFYLNEYLDYYKMEDIKGIEVMYNNQYNSRYNTFYFNKGLPPDFAFIEITTRSGNGPFVKHTPGRYLYKPMLVLAPKQFYSPKYGIKNNTPIGADLRSTIYWKPDLISDANGKAAVSFYSADKPGSYSVILEGSDMNGNIGYQHSSIQITLR